MRRQRSLGSCLIGARTLGVLPIRSLTPARLPFPGHLPIGPSSPVRRLLRGARWAHVSVGPAAGLLFRWSPPAARLEPLPA
jgi:hypothetical protein